MESSIVLCERGPYVSFADGYSKYSSEGLRIASPAAVPTSPNPYWIPSSTASSLAVHMVCG